MKKETKTLMLDTFQKVTDLEEEANEARNTDNMDKYWKIQNNINLFNKWLRALEFNDLAATRVT
ncbi:hypothetical protein ACFLZ4_02270 [Patescibacteria group bacterium]